MNLEKRILSECKKLIARHQGAVATQRVLRKRFEKRTGKDGGTKQVVPVTWGVNTQFNPYLVRRNAAYLGEKLEQAIRSGEYAPLPALELPIDKPSGGKRYISVFGVPDSAVATTFFRRLVGRNESRMSPFSYAYRESVGAHDALERLWREFSLKTRLYLVEFDFSKYFDTISHDYLLEAMHRNFKVTRSESTVVEAFLRSRRSFGCEKYAAGVFANRRRGIPQGNSLSLFLANVACHDLDMELARHGYVFARYADDIIVLTDGDSAAGAAFELVQRHCEVAGVSINFDKSRGISLCSPEGLRKGARPDAVPYFDYLGHRFQFRVVRRAGNPAPSLVRRLSLRESTLKKAKAKLSRIIYAHLLRYPKEGLFKKKRINTKAGIDWDVVTCINDLRGYLYGGLTEDALRDALTNRAVRLHRIDGLLGFYPLLNDIEQLRALDGWLLHALASAITRREELLRTKCGVRSYPKLDAGSLERADWYEEAKAGIANDVRVPSLVRAWKYSKLGLRAFNLKSIPSRALDDDRSSA